MEKATETSTQKFVYNQQLMRPVGIALLIVAPLAAATLWKLGRASRTVYIGSATVAASGLATLLITRSPKPSYAPTHGTDCVDACGIRYPHHTFTSLHGTGEEADSGLIRSLLTHGWEGVDQKLANRALVRLTQPARGLAMLNELCKAPLPEEVVSAVGLSLGDKLDTWDKNLSRNWCKLIKAQGLEDIVLAAARKRPTDDPRGLVAKISRHITPNLGDLSAYATALDVWGIRLDQITLDRSLIPCQMLLEKIEIDLQEMAGLNVLTGTFTPDHRDDLLTRLETVWNAVPQTVGTLPLSPAGKTLQTTVQTAKASPADLSELETLIGKLAGSPPQIHNLAVYAAAAKGGVIMPITIDSSLIPSARLVQRLVSKKRSPLPPTDGKPESVLRWVVNLQRYTPANLGLVAEQEPAPYDRANNNVALALLNAWTLLDYLQTNREWMLNNYGKRTPCTYPQLIERARQVANTQPESLHHLQNLCTMVLSTASNYKIPYVRHCLALSSHLHTANRYAHKNPLEAALLAIETFAAHPPETLAPVKPLMPQEVGNIFDALLIDFEKRSALAAPSERE